MIQYKPKRSGVVRKVHRNSNLRKHHCVIKMMYQFVLFNDYQLKSKSAEKSDDFNIFFFKLYIDFFWHDLILRCTISGDVKQTEGKPVSLFESKHLTVPHTFHVFNPFIKCILIRSLSIFKKQIIIIFLKKYFVVYRRSYRSRNICSRKLSEIHKCKIRAKWDFVRYKKKSVFLSLNL